MTFNSYIILIIYHKQVIIDTKDTSITSSIDLVSLGAHLIAKSMISPHLLAKLTTVDWK